MTLFDPHALSLLVRWVHVASMALLLGGAVLLWGLSLRAGSLPAAEQDRLLLFVAGRYETFFWAALGLIVITGIGNLGALGLALPAANTAWGGKFVVKLALVLLFVPLSLVRTLLIVRLDAPVRPAPAMALPSTGLMPDAAPMHVQDGIDSAPASPQVRVLRYVYGGTSLYAVGILLAAVLLAHGG